MKTLNVKNAKVLISSDDGETFNEFGMVGWQSALARKIEADKVIEMKQEFSLSWEHEIPMMSNPIVRVKCK